MSLLNFHQSPVSHVNYQAVHACLALRFLFNSTSTRDCLW